MAKLTLVKARIISSKEELTAFKKESTAALLNFAESNDCDLEAMSAALTKKYAEIDQALNEGYRVESEIEIHPQPAPPVHKTACMQSPTTAAVAGDPVHRALPVQQDEGNPEAQDPADLVEAQQEREIADSRITMEDIAKLMAESPEKQPIASDIVAAAPQIGQTAAFRLLAGLAYDRYTVEELKTIAASLKVIAADEEADAAPATEGDEGAVITHEPKGKSAEQITIEQHFSEGVFKAINDMVSKFNQLMDEVDPEMQLLPPITVEEIVSKMNVEKRRERIVDEQFVPPTSINPATLDRYVLPNINKLSPEEKAAVVEGFSKVDIDKAIDQWYGDMGLNSIDDMITGVEQYLTEQKVEGFTGKQIVDQYLASHPEGHIQYADIKSVIGELRQAEKATAEYQTKIQWEAEHPGQEYADSRGTALEEQFHEQRQKEIQLQNDPKEIAKRQEAEEQARRQKEQTAPTEETDTKSIDYSDWLHARDTHPVLKAIEPGDIPEDKMGAYTVKVVDNKSGKTLGYYADEASAKFDYPHLKKD